jgi:glutathione S-transferase
MKIFGDPISMYTRRVLMTLEENKVPYELEFVGLTNGDAKQPAFVALQPFGQIPALQDGDFELYESRAMSRYIDGKVNGPLTPRDLRERARMDQWLSIEASEFSGPAIKLVLHHVFQREQPHDVLETAKAQLDIVLAIMDKQLASHPFIAGDSFSLADVSFMPYFEYVMNTPAKAQFTKYAHVMAWWNKISERPTWRKVAGR